MGCHTICCLSFERLLRREKRRESIAHWHLYSTWTWIQHHCYECTGADGCGRARTKMEMKIKMKKQKILRTESISQPTSTVLNITNNRESDSRGMEIATPQHVCASTAGIKTELVE